MTRYINRKYKELKLKRFLGLGFLTLVLLFFWQLYRAPIALPFLKPYIIKALNHDDADFEVSLSSVNLELVKSIKPIKIVANNVKYKNAKNSLNIEAPKVSVAFSIHALLKGMVAPSSIEINSPKIYVFKTYGIKKQEKEISEKIINQKKMESLIDEFNLFMERFNSEDKIYSESYINNIQISNASLEFHEVDLGKKFVFSDMNYQFNRYFSDIKMSFSSFLKSGKIFSPLGVELEYRPKANKLALEVYASDLIPSKSFGKLFGADINIALSGRVQTLFDLSQLTKYKKDVLLGVEKSVSKIIFDLEGGKGGIVFDGLDDYVYNISEVMLKGDIEAGLDHLRIKDAMFNLDNQKIAVSFEASGMKKLLLEDSLEDVRLSIKTKTNNLSFKRLTELWPKYASPAGWQWCKDGLTDGVAKNVNFKFDFNYDKKTKSVAFDKLNGSVEVFDTTVAYLSGMPTINNVYGVANFDNSSIKINIDKAVSDGVSLNGGYVKLYDLNKDNPAIDIKLKATTAIPDALRLISHPPLEFGKDLGVSADKIFGFGEVELDLNFLLIKNILAKDVNIKLDVLAEDVKVLDVLGDLSFSSKALKLTLDNNKMQVLGDGFIDNIPITLDWLEDFNQKDFKSKYKIGFKLTEAVKKKLEIDLQVLTPPYVIGLPDVDANVLVLKNGKTKVDLDIDLTSSSLDFSFLGLVKDKGENATILANLEFADEHLISIPYFSFNQFDFNLNGNVKFDNKFRIKEVNIPDIKGPKTLASSIFKVDYSKKAPQYDINIAGQSYNLTKFFSQKEKNEKNDDSDDDWLEKTENANVSINVNSLWTIDEFPIKNFVGTANMKNGVGVKELHLTGNFENKNNSMIKLSYEPRGEGFFLDIDSTDAGSTLQVLGLYDNMRDGVLKIQGIKGKDKKLVGHVKLRDFRLYNTPVLTRLLSVASLSGIVNMLTGEGLVFSHFDAPFEAYKKILMTKGAKASGNVMVITANGTLNRKTDDINIDGVIAPLRGLDNLLGKIPLIGNWLKGSDGTLFASNYKITGNVSNPKVDINPFSALSEQSAKDLRGIPND